MPDVIETTDAAASTSTTYTLQIGKTAQGSISALGDHDWFRVDLVAGQTYTFALAGTGSSGVSDPILALHGPSGTTVVASNDDGLPNHNSVFTYTAATSGSYYIDVGAFDSAGTGQYGVSVASGSRATVDVQMGAGIIDVYSGSGESSWSGTPGTGATVTVGFRITDDGLEQNFSQFTSEQIAATQAILQYYIDVCGLTFNLVNPGSYTDNATILLSNYNFDDDSGGYASYPGSTSANDQAGNIHINLHESSSALLPVGSYSFYTLLHEMGHAVGLSHPGLYNAGPGQNITYATDAQFTQDTHQYSVMSYFDASNTTTSDGSYPDTLMLLDIYALQQIYGANTATRAGNTVYGFNSTAGGVYNFTTNTNPALCIWDGGGIDTLDVSGYTSNQVISLVAGTFSDIGQAGYISIALGAIIENATGGSGNDTVYLAAGNVDNIINGMAGSDIVYVTYAFNGGYTLSGSYTNFTITGNAGSDIFLGVEFVHFSDGTQVSSASLFGATADDYLGSTATTGQAATGLTVSGELETIGDRDWFRVEMVAGAPYTLTLQGLTLDDPYLYLYNGSGVLLASNDDFNGLGSQLVYQPSASGTYYIGAGAFEDADAGTYALAVSGGPSPTGGMINTLTLTQQLELIYIGYFDRAADGEGFNFWSGQNASAQAAGQGAAQALTNIANSFRPQAETLALYPLLGTSNPDFSSGSAQVQLSAFLDEVYQNLFNRTPDAAGKAYWTGQISSGAVGFGAAILAIANGAQGTDVTILQNKITVALDFTFDTRMEGLGLPANAAFLSAAHGVLDGVSASSASVLAGMAETDVFIDPASLAIPLVGLPAGHSAELGM